jgi:hypothetical protein
MEDQMSSPEDMAHIIRIKAQELDELTEQLKGWRLSSNRLIMLDAALQELDRASTNYRMMAKARHRHNGDKE